MGYQTINGLTEKELTLWNRVDELWRCSVNRDFPTINKAIHPQYVGWDTNSITPHDRKYAIQSITDEEVKLNDYQLFPLKITIFEDRVGIANYRYNARIRDLQKNVRAIKGRWTEIYLKKQQQWILIGVHGGTEEVKVISATDIY